MLSGWDQEDAREDQGALRGCIASRAGYWVAKGSEEERGFGWKTAAVGKAEEGAEATSCHHGSLKHDIYIKAAPFLWVL